MRSFLKIFFASFLALIIFAVLGVIILVGIISSATSADKPVIDDKSVLVLDLSKEYHEQQTNDPISEFTGDYDNNVPGLYDIVRMIDYAAADNHIKGIYVR